MHISLELRIPTDHPPPLSLLVDISVSRHSFLAQYDIYNVATGRYDSMKIMMTMMMMTMMMMIYNVATGRYDALNPLLKPTAMFLMIRGKR